MKRGLWVVLLIYGVVFSVASQERIREYTINKTVTPPTIDGVFTEEEWAGSEFASGFFGLRNGAVSAQYQGTQVDLGYRWRALWDDEFLYFLFEGELKFLTPNGLLFDGSFVDPLLSDDTGYSGFAVAENVDLEVFLEPNWLEGDGFNSNPPDFTDAGTSHAYQFVWFPLADDIFDGEVFTEGNDGIRDKAEGPPFAFTGLQGGPGDWAVIFDPDEAQAAGVQPMIFAGLLGEIEGATPIEDIIARPVLEVAFPFSQFTPAVLPDVETAEDLNPMADNLLLERNDDGSWVQPGDGMVN